MSSCRWSSITWSGKSANAASAAAWSRPRCTSSTAGATAASEVASSGSMGPSELCDCYAAAHARARARRAGGSAPRVSVRAVLVANKHLLFERASKKKFLTRIDSKLYESIRKWAEDDFRSVNGQIEFLLNKCVKERKRLNK